MRFKYLFVLLVAIGCRSNDDNQETVSSFLNQKLVTDIESVFKSRDIKGCFILHDLKADTSIIYNPQRAQQSFLPASTFKILNSMIALECGVVEDEIEVIRWDSVERSIPIWNQEHNMRTGIKNSVVWFYQELARRIGEERMQTWVDSVSYGNQQIGREIDNFWLVGDLRISPIEQVEFLKKLIEEDLPFKKEVISTVKDILIEDENDTYTFRAKTGWATKGIGVGWYVGYLEIDGRTYIFVNNLEIQDAEDANARKEITKEVFKKVSNIDLNI